MNPQIEVRLNGGMISNGETLFFNFDNGLQVKSFLHKGIVQASWVRLGKIEVIESREKMGADAFSDFLHEISTYTNAEAKKLAMPRGSKGANQMLGKILFSKKSEKIPNYRFGKMVNGKMVWS